MVQHMIIHHQGGGKTEVSHGAGKSNWNSTASLRSTYWNYWHQQYTSTSPSKNWYGDANPGLYRNFKRRRVNSQGLIRTIQLITPHHSRNMVGMKTHNHQGFTTLIKHQGFFKRKMIFSLQMFSLLIIKNLSHFFTSLLLPQTDYPLLIKPLPRDINYCIFSLS